jgi:hypothetical protein
MDSGGTICCSLPLVSEESPQARLSRRGRLLRGSGQELRSLTWRESAVWCSGRGPTGPAQRSLSGSMSALSYMRSSAKTLETRFGLYATADMMKENISLSLSNLRTVALGFNTMGTMTRDIHPSTFGLVAGLGVGAGIFYYRSLVNAHLTRSLSPRIVMVHANVQKVMGLANERESHQWAWPQSLLSRALLSNGVQRVRVVRGVLADADSTRSRGAR